MSWYKDLRKDIWKYALVGIALISIGLNVLNYSNLANSATKISLGTSQSAISFSSCLNEAIPFLDVNTLEEINKSITAYTDMGQAGLEALWTLTYLNPANERDLDAIEAVITVLFVAKTNPPTVPQVLGQLRDAVPANATATMNAMIDLKEIASQRVQEIGVQVAEAFTSTVIDTSKLGDAVSQANQLKTDLDQWISKYSVSS